MPPPDKPAKPGEGRADELAGVVEQLGLGPESRGVVGALRDLGISTEAMRRALERGRLEDAVFDAVIDPARSGRTVSARQVEAAGGLSVGEIAEFMLAFGLADPDPDEPFFSDEELRSLVELAELRDLWPRQIRIQASRVYGQALARLARSELALFRTQVEPGLQGAPGGEWESLAAVRNAFERLIPIADTWLVGVHRRWIEHELTAAAAFEAEALAGAEAIPGATRVTILFLDLKDFTRYADEHGDVAAVEAIERFARAVYERRGRSGEIVKALGDGYMLAYPHATEAIDGAIAVAREVGRAGPPFVHASASTGVAILRDGDYFGSVVNVAARLLNSARSAELLATRDTVDAAGGDLAWEPRGERGIRGMRHRVEVLSLAL